MRCLVYVDASSRGEWAISLAAQLAASLESVVLLATAEDAVQTPNLLSAARARLSASPRVAEKQAPGPAEQAILAEVGGGSYDLVIVPPAGRNALARMLKGSRVATVVRSVRASVLVARRPPARIAKLLVAVSGGASSAAVVSAGLELEQAFSAKAEFLHVASEVMLPYEPHGGGSPKAPEDPAARARAALASQGRALTEREGLVVEEVLAEVENGAYDLLVAGAAREAQAGGWAKDDVIERILLRCPISMLIVRSG
jgi:nucleotide-binding universal stress UspA family protein